MRPDGAAGFFQQTGKGSAGLGYPSAGADRSRIEQIVFLSCPGDTPVLGSYRFDKADLGPFPGIAGVLSSTGEFKGQLNKLEVGGETTTPDFSLDNVGKPVPLRTDFSATVDGTNGDTLLHPVHTLLGESVIVASGSVEKVPKKGHDILLEVTTPRARIEDILQLAINSDRPFLSRTAGRRRRGQRGDGYEGRFRAERQRDSLFEIDVFGSRSGRRARGHIRNRRAED